MSGQNQKQQSHALAKGGHMTPSANTNKRALQIVAWLTGIYFVIELGIGVWTGSVAVISDAFHTFSAVGGVLVALVAGQFAMRSATKIHTFGFLRAEIVGALLNGLFLFAMAILVIWMGIMRLSNPIELPTTPMILVALGGLTIEIFAIRLMWAGQKKSINMKGAFWHVLQTFVGSLIIIVAALVIRFTGFLAIDPILGMAFGLVLFWASWKITREAIDILLDRVPKELNLAALEQAMKAVPGVKNIHHLHARSLTEGKNIVSAHVLTEKTADHTIMQKQLFQLTHTKFPVYFSTFQLEKQCLEKSEAREIDTARTSSKQKDS